MLYYIQLAAFTVIAMSPLGIALGLTVIGTPPIELILSAGAILLPAIGLGTTDLVGNFEKSPYFAY